MKLSVQYLNDDKGDLKAVQLTIPEWNKLMSKLSKYEELFRVKSDLVEALGQVKKLRAGKLKGQTLSEFLHEL